MKSCLHFEDRKTERDIEDGSSAPGLEGALVTFVGEEGRLSLPLQGGAEETVGDPPSPPLSDAGPAPSQLGGADHSRSSLPGVRAIRTRKKKRIVKIV